MTKRFFEKADIAQDENGFCLLLDSLTLKTPAKNTLIVPTKELAELLAEEWNACGDTIDTMKMPYNRLVNTSLDRVPDTVEDLADSFVSYGNNDLLCYRAAHPDALVTRQAEVWNPILDWCRQCYDVSFQLADGTEGIQPIDQPAKTLARLRAIYLENPENSLKLGGLSHATALLGSAVLTLALENKFLDAKKAYEAAFVDELFQIAQWGVDEEAQKRLDKLATEIDQVSVFFSVIG